LSSQPGFDLAKNSVLLPPAPHCGIRMLPVPLSWVSSENKRVQHPAVPRRRSPCSGRLYFYRAEFIFQFADQPAGSGRPDGQGLTLPLRPDELPDSLHRFLSAAARLAAKRTSVWTSAVTGAMPEGWRSVWDAIRHPKEGAWLLVKLLRS
jgi:hypothetical protein